MTQFRPMTSQARARNAYPMFCVVQLSEYREYLAHTLHEPSRAADTGLGGESENVRGDRGAVVELAVLARLEEGVRDHVALALVVLRAVELGRVRHRCDVRYERRARREELLWRCPGEQDA